jgi:hypothetical protein
MRATLSRNVAALAPAELQNARADDLRRQLPGGVTTLERVTAGDVARRHRIRIELVENSRACARRGEPDAS